MDLEALGPAPDIDNIDTSTMDFGNGLEAAAPPAAEPPSQAELEQEVDEANGKEPDAEPAEEEERAPRDEKGRFVEKEARIPKSRFDEAVGKEREAREAAERRAAELEERLQRQQQSATAEQERSQIVEQIDGKITELEAKYQDMLLDGDTKGAAAVMREIRLAERTLAKMEAQEESAAIVSQEMERQRFQVAVARLEADHPELNPQSETYDEELVGMVLLVQRDMVSSGIPPSQALVQATHRVMARIQPPKQAEPEQGLAKAKPEDRRQQAIEKALAAQNAQPASLKEVGYDSDSRGEKGLPDVTKMTADEFDALPEATKARLMGNFV